MLLPDKLGLLPPVTAQDLIRFDVSSPIRVQFQSSGSYVLLASENVLEQRVVIKDASGGEPFVLPVGGINWYALRAVPASVLDNST
jgi:hypothetical protein